MKRSLTGAWLFRATDQENFLPAEVPGCQYLDMMKNGVIPDPFIGTNESAVAWIHDKDFIYRKTFLITEEELKNERIDLTFLCVDTIAEVRLNDRVLGQTKNCFFPYVFSVKDLLVLGENVLEVTFFSPKKYVEDNYRRSPTPLNPNGQNGIVHIRKPQCHFGWDWGPNLIPVGLSDEVFLDFSTLKKLSDPEIKVDKSGEKFIVTVRADNAETISLTDPDGNVIVENGDNATFSVDRPQLWWTRELSQKEEQPLYTVTAVGKGDKKEKKIGLRTIELNRERDDYGYNFQFRLNGVPIFVKGANYIPSDAFITRFDKKRLQRLLDAVVFSNMNMIRVWGGGYYADEELLSECDRRGILVWQDFPYACQAYPFFEKDFLDNVLKETEYNVKRISSHPCLAVWCGNNEIEAAHLAWMTMKKYIDWTEKFFYHILPDTVARFDGRTPYTPGSPAGTGHNQNVQADFAGDTHLWGVWHGLQPMNYYRKRMTRFCSEFGFESLPSFRTVQGYAEPKDYPLKSAVQKFHQKCVGGNDKMLHYIADRFPLSEDIEDLVYLSQVTQATCISDAAEHWRRHKGRCNGAIYWQLNDCWPTCSWSGYDYNGEYKALLYAGRDFYAPVSLSIEDTKEEVTVCLLNDLPEGKTVETETVKFSFSGEKIEKKRRTFTVNALENKILFSIPAKEIDGKKEGLAFRLYIGGVLIQQKTFLSKKEKDVLLPKAPITVTEKEENGKRIYALSSPVYQRLVMLRNDCEKPFSDNFFDILPGETKIVTQDLAPAGKLSYRTVASVKKTSGIKTFFAKVKVYFSVRNLLNLLYNIKIPKNNF